jgi:hypothetical protein
MFRDWRTYLQYMSKSSAWGDQLTLFAAAQVYKRSICIISSVAAESMPPYLYVNQWLAYKYVANKRAYLIGL